MRLQRTQAEVVIKCRQEKGSALGRKEGAIESQANKVWYPTRRKTKGRERSTAGPNQIGGGKGRLAVKGGVASRKCGSRCGREVHVSIDRTPAVNLKKNGERMISQVRKERRKKPQKGQQRRGPGRVETVRRWWDRGGFGVRLSKRVTSWTSLLGLRKKTLSRIQEVIRKRAKKKIDGDARGFLYNSFIS